MIILPDKKTLQWFQQNRSDIIGTMAGSFNLNLTEQLGKTKISPRMVITTNGVMNLDCPVAFKGFGGDIYAIAGAYAWTCTNGLLRTAFAQLGSNNKFSSDISDLEIFNNRMYASGGDTHLYRLGTDGSLFDLGSVISNSFPSKLLNFTKLNRLYAVNGLLMVISCDTSESVATSGANTITLVNAELQITSLLQTETLIWLLTINTNNGIGFVYTWDGVTADTPTDIITLDSRGALAGIVKDDVPYIIDTDGKLMKHNGQVFIMEPNGQLPINLKKYLINPLSSVNNRWIHPNGMTLVNGRINILVNNENYDNARTIQEFLPSGIWEYVENGAESYWYHKAALTLYDLSSSNAILDYGQNRLARVGALANLKPADNTSLTTVGTILAGANYFVDSAISSYVSAIFTDDSLDLISKYGYLVTTKILSAKIQDSWSNLYAKIRPLLNSLDTIYLKYRSNDDVATEVSITWVSGNSFTTTTDVTKYVPGNEVEILSGNGSGWCPNIVSITNNGGTYSVVLDQYFITSISGTGRARFQTWVSAGLFSTQGKSLASFAVKAVSPWIQLKMAFFFTGNDELVEMALINAPYQ